MVSSSVGGAPVQSVTQQKVHKNNCLEETLSNRAWPESAARFAIRPQSGVTTYWLECFVRAALRRLSVVGVTSVAVRVLRMRIISATRISLTETGQVRIALLPCGSIWGADVITECVHRASWPSQSGCGP